MTMLKSLIFQQTLSLSLVFPHKLPSPLSLLHILTFFGFFVFVFVLLFCFGFWQYRGLTQGFVLARQVFYCLSHTSSPTFFKGVLFFIFT
jgi:uncharacterized membrane protein